MENSKVQTRQYRYLKWSIRELLALAAALLPIMLIGLLLCGCVSSNDAFSGRNAIIDDVTGQSPHLAGHCVTAVDGEPVRRASSSTVSVIPMVVVDPGQHTISIGDRTVTATFEAGKSYRISRENGELSVIEKDD